MSGLCGIWAPAATRQDLSSAVQAGLDAMVHRGRDGFSIVSDADFSLGHCLLDTGCNGFAVDEDGFAISFDGRIDNRAALLDALRRPMHDTVLELGNWSDKYLLLLAYRCFGEEFPAMLRGDFAIAIRDPIRKELFLCRDHMGVRPLFYRQIAGECHFASEIKGLRAMAPDHRMNVRDAAADGYVRGDGDPGDPARTFFQDVLRLLPGHFARVGSAGVTLGEYWRLDPDLPKKRADTAATFRALLIQAIDRRMRTTLPVAALLSGGLDSSSIVSLIGARETCATAARTKIYSLTFPGEPTEDETHYIDAVLQAYDLDGAKVSGSDISAFQDLDTIIAEQDHPPPAPNASTYRYFLRSVANDSGARVVLNGHGGDEVVSHGTGLFFELAENGQWLRLWRELGESVEILGERAPHFWRLLRRKGLRGWLRRGAAVVRRRQRKLDDRVTFTGTGRRRPTEQAMHLAMLVGPDYAQALEVIDHEAAAAGVEVRMPFLDVDLVSFCVTVRAEEKWAHGYSRLSLRAALAGILPDVVATRRDKFDFAGHVQRTILRNHAAMVEDTLRTLPHRLAPYVDIADLRAKWRTLKESEAIDGGAMMQIWRAVVLSRWLQLNDAPAPARAPALVGAP